MFSQLSRDAEFIRKLTPPKVIQSLMVSMTSSTAFVTKMTRRYSDMLEEQDFGKMQDKIVKLVK